MPGISARSKEMKEFQSEDDMRTLIRAAEIKQDKPRLRAALSKLKKQQEAVNAAAKSKA